MSTKPEDTPDYSRIETLHRQNGKSLADQVVKRREQKVADELRGKNQSVGERDKQSENEI